MAVGLQDRMVMTRAGKRRMSTGRFCFMPETLAGGERDALQARATRQSDANVNGSLIYEARNGYSEVPWMMRGLHGRATPCWVVPTECDLETQTGAGL